MKHLSLAGLALLAALTPFASHADVAPPAPPPRLGAPITYQNLTIFPVRGEAGRPSNLLTLQDAMANKLVRVHETGNVNSLQVENLGDQEIFIQAGDIVKGGKQDRVLSVDLVLPPKSGRISIAAFCVEQGRWSGRGGEKTDAFASSDTALPSKSIKLATRPRMAEPGNLPANAAKPQQQVWEGVRETQRKLGGNVGSSVAAAPSPTSLQLTMENDKLKASVADYEKAFADLLRQTPDAVGYVMAINGKINSADIYNSPELFQRMWPKLLNAAAIEAISEKGGTPPPPVSGDAASAFLDQFAATPAVSQQVSSRNKVLTRENDKGIAQDTELSDGVIVHRNYLAK
jgi:hypothetical protein